MSKEEMSFFHQDNAKRGEDIVQAEVPEQELTAVDKIQATIQEINTLLNQNEYSEDFANKIYGDIAKIREKLIDKKDQEK